MDEISHAQNRLGEAREQFNQGRGRATVGKSTLEEACRSFDAMQAAKVDAIARALAMVEKLGDVQDELRELVNTTDEGRKAAKAVHSAAKEAEDDFWLSRHNAMEGGLRVSQTMGQPLAWAEYAPAKEAVEKEEGIQTLTHHVVLEASTTNTALTRFTEETATSLQAALEGMTTTLNEFVGGHSGLSRIGQSYPIRRSSEEHRNPEFIAGAADELIATFDTGIVDIDQKLEEL